MKLEYNVSFELAEYLFSLGILMLIILYNDGKIFVCANNQKKKLINNQ